MVLEVYPEILLIARFDDFILADELFAKVLRSLKAYLSVNNKLCAKLVWTLASPVTFDGRLKVISVTIFIPDLVY